MDCCKNDNCRMMAIRMWVTVPFILCLSSLVSSSHFRGGIIQWRPLNAQNFNGMVNSLWFSCSDPSSKTRHTQVSVNLSFRLKLLIAWLGGDHGVAMVALHPMLEPLDYLDLALSPAKLDVVARSVPCSSSALTLTVLKIGCLVIEPTRTTSERL